MLLSRGDIKKISEKVVHKLMFYQNNDLAELAGLLCWHCSHNKRITAILNRLFRNIVVKQSTQVAMFQGLSTATEMALSCSKYKKKVVHLLTAKINRLFSNIVVEKLTHALMFHGLKPPTAGADRQNKIEKVVNI